MRTPYAQIVIHCGFKSRGDQEFESAERFWATVDSAGFAAFFAGFGTGRYLSCG
jgi:hypothetical protein